VILSGHFLVDQFELLRFDSNELVFLRIAFFFAVFLHDPQHMVFEDRLLVLRTLAGTFLVFGATEEIDPVRSSSIIPTLVGIVRLIASIKLSNTELLSEIKVCGSPSP
jgi:hypothetical protein